MGKIVYMYNPCCVCGNNDFDAFLIKDDRDLADGTPCIRCPECGRYGSTANWNRVNGSIIEDPDPVAV